MRKSETGTFLPSIRSQRASLTRHPRMKSLFLERVKQEVTKEASYEAMEGSLISEEQQRLKQLLREFNDRSQSILNDYISGPPKVKQTSTARVSLDSFRKVVQQEEANLQKIINQCQTELKLLEARCQNLKYMSRDEVIRQIRQTQQEIDQLRVEKKNLQRGVTVDGLNICRGEHFDQVPDLQYQRGQLQAKRIQLEASNKELDMEIQLLKERTQAAQKQIVASEAEYKVALEQMATIDESEKAKEDVKQKKKQIEYIKIKNQTASGVLKQKYYTKLKQYDDFKNQTKKSAMLIEQHDEEIDRSKKELIVLEHRLSALKQKTTTLHLLAKN